MKPYNFRRLILKDKTVLVFFIFFFINSFSYSTEVLFKTTLIPFRISLMILLLGFLIEDEIISNSLNIIYNRFVFIFILFYSFSFAVNFTTSDPLFFFSLVVSMLLFSLFVNFLKRHYPGYSAQILTDIFLYALLYIPLLLILNPGYISLNLYASNDIEHLGIKSRYLGWACAIIFGILLYRSTIRKMLVWEKILLAVSIFFVVSSGSRSALIGICATTLLFFINQRNKFRFISVSVVAILLFLILFNDQILNLRGQVSFQKRTEARAQGSSDDTYRETVLKDAINLSCANMEDFIFGFGAGSFKETLKHLDLRYSENDLSSHNTYLEVFFTSGIFSFLAFLFLYVIVPLKKYYSKNKALLYVFIPVVIISTTENNFGLGQYLFVMFSLLAFYSFKL